MTSARIQPLCREYNINIGYYDGYSVYPRNFTDRKVALKMHYNNFCLISKSNGISLSQAIGELEPNFKVIDKVITDKHVKRFDKYEYKLFCIRIYQTKKVQSHLANINVYDLETFNTNKAVPYANCIYRSSKTSGKFNRDITDENMRNVEKIVLFLEEQIVLMLDCLTTQRRT